MLLEILYKLWRAISRYIPYQDSHCIYYTELIIVHCRWWSLTMVSIFKDSEQPMSSNPVTKALWLYLPYQDTAPVQMRGFLWKIGPQPLCKLPTYKY